MSQYFFLFWSARSLLCQEVGTCEESEGIETSVDGLGTTRMLPEDKDKDILDIVRQPILSAHLRVLCYIPQATSEKQSRLRHIMPV